MSTEPYPRAVEVYFHEATDPGWYHVSFEDVDDHPVGIHPNMETIEEDLERQLGEPYERAVDPGEHVYVGTLKYNPDTGDWAFNRLEPEQLGVDLDGETHEEETTIEESTEQLRERAIEDEDDEP